VANSRTPIVFVHGLWLHADSWKPWADYFRDAGYEPIAPGWPGDGATVAETRQHPDKVAGYGVDDVVNHFAKVIDGLDSPPILIGHSFGGLIVQKLLGQGRGAAAVAIDPAPIKGVRILPISSLRASAPVLKNPANRKRAITLTREQFRYAFTNAVSAAEAERLYDEHTIAAPGKPLFEAAFANLSTGTATKVDTRNNTRGPLLLVSGEKDHTVPPAIPRATLKRYRGSSAVTEIREFPGRGHSLTIDEGWVEIADFSAKWLAEHGIS
jgi:non-heme chloroperoxidase